MKYEKSLFTSQFAYGKILSTYVELFSPVDGTKLWSMQKEDQFTNRKAVNGLEKRQNIKDQKNLNLQEPGNLQKLDLTNQTQTQTTIETRVFIHGFGDQALVCTLGMQQPYQQNNYIDVILTESAVSFILKIGGEKVYQKLAANSFMVRVKPVALDWTPVEYTAIKKLIPDQYMTSAQEKSIIAMINGNAGLTNSAEVKQITKKRNIGFIATAISLLLSN